MFSYVLLAAVTVLPSDRMAMADRLFDKGEYVRAKSEYIAIKGEPSIPADELLYRIAESCRLSGDSEKARQYYGELINKHVSSRHLNRSRLMRAMLLEGEARVSELKKLDSDLVRNDIRACALYNIGVARGDRDALKRCVRMDPKGPYVYYAKFHHASLCADDPNPAVRRSAVGELNEIFLQSKDANLAREALYFAAVRSYGDKRYGESSILFRRYLEKYPSDSRLENARRYAAWSDFLDGRYADASSLCGDGSTDDAAYILAASAYSMGERDKARELMKSYLGRFAAGKYRSSVELPLSRIEFEDAEKKGDVPKMIESARRSVMLSKSAADRIRLAWAYEKGGDEKTAADHYQQIAKDFPGSDEALESLYRKALIDIKAGKWLNAEKSLSEMLSSEKKTSREAEALYWRGISAVRLGHEEIGVEYLKKALSKGISLNYTREAKLILADEDFKAGREESAREAYKKLVKEGAAERMSAAKLSAVGWFLLSGKGGEPCPAEAKECAKALLKIVDASPAWKQEAFALLGEAEESGNEIAAAIGSYRQALAENVCTERRRHIALRLGVLLCKIGEATEAEDVLNEAVRLNMNDTALRAKAYLYLAKVRESIEDRDGAVKYATYVTSLFDEPDAVSEAQKIIDAYSNEVK